MNCQSRVGQLPLHRPRPFLGHHLVGDSIRFALLLISGRADLELRLNEPVHRTVADGALQIHNVFLRQGASKSELPSLPIIFNEFTEDCFPVFSNPDVTLELRDSDVSFGCSRVF